MRSASPGLLELRGLPPTGVATRNVSSKLLSSAECFRKAASMLEKHRWQLGAYLTVNVEVNFKADGSSKAGSVESTPNACRHFFSEKGCSRGDNCRFSHAAGNAGVKKGLAALRFHPRARGGPPAMAAAEAAAEDPGGTADSLVGTHTWSKPQGDKQHENFRYNNVRFLQEQNKEATKALDRVEEERDEAFAAIAQWEERRQHIQQEYQKLQQELADTEEKCNISAAEIHKRDEQIRVLSEQNRSLLDMLEEEERSVKERQTQAQELMITQDRLQKISDEYNLVKATGQQQLLGAYNEIAKFEEELRNAQSETGQLKEALRKLAH
eukprot:s244_g32.t1